MSAAFEYGTLTFLRTSHHRRSVDVELDEDGTVAVAWCEKADDGWGSCERRVYFTAAEFDEIIIIRQREMEKR